MLTLPFHRANVKPFDGFLFPSQWVLKRPIVLLEISRYRAGDIARLCWIIAGVDRAVRNHVPPDVEEKFRNAKQCVLNYIIRSLKPSVPRTDDTWLFRVTLRSLVQVAEWKSGNLS